MFSSFLGAARQRSTLLGGFLVGAGLVACGAASTAPSPAAPSSAVPGPVKPLPKPPLPRDIVAKSAHPLHAELGNERLGEPALWDRLQSARALCFGEQHDKPEHHFAQQRAISELATRAAAAQRKLGVGFEMFQRPYQAP